MDKRVRRQVRRALEVTGLIGAYYRWRLRREILTPVEQVDDGLPMPPRDLIMDVVAVNGQPSWFSSEGQRTAGDFEKIANRYGIDLESGVSVLDFGCGAGRIARWLAHRVVGAGGSFHGSDINPRLVGWCRENLPGSYAENGLKPPLGLPSNSIDLLYAHSVLTHLREDTARAWLREFRRVLKPGGVAVLTFHDENFAQAWGPPEAREGLAHSDYVVVNNALEGSNYMSAWTRQDYFRGLAGADYEVLEIIPGALDHPIQATAVLRPR
jgi:SAM-dependent methyltransferase